MKEKAWRDDKKGRKDMRGKIKMEGERQENKLKLITWNFQPLTRKGNAPSVHNSYSDPKSGRSPRPLGSASDVPSTWLLKASTLKWHCFNPRCTVCCIEEKVNTPSLSQLAGSYRTKDEPGGVRVFSPLTWRLKIQSTD